MLQSELDICDRCGLNPNVFYRWQKVFFENGFGGFELIGRVVRMVFGPETGFSGVAFLKLCSLFADTYVIDSGRKVRRRAARRESTAKSVGEVG